MGPGLFGKLPARRDFVTVGVSPRVLAFWEGWIEAGLRESREVLGDDWPSAFEMTPPWRFWLGPDHCGETVVGVFVPSCDGVGRSYPLAVLATASFEPPQMPQEAWFAEAEALLLTARGWGRDFVQTRELLTCLPEPEPSDTSKPDDVCIGSDDLAAELIVDDGCAGFSRLTASTMPPLLAQGSLWWTRGHSGKAAAARLVLVGAPKPSLFTALISQVRRAGASR